MTSEEALALLKRSSAPHEVRFLLQALVDSGADHPTVLTKLVALDDRAACRPLIQLLNFDGGRVREAAAYALGFLRCWRARHPLLKVLLDKAEEPNVRGQAAEALGYLLEFCAPKVKDRFLVPILGCLGDDQPAVRFWTCFALAQLKDERAINELERLTLDEAVVDGWWTVGGEASWALAAIHGSPDADLIWETNSERSARGPAGAGVPPAQSTRPTRSAP